MKYKYEIGDYVLLDDSDTQWRVYLEVKILDKNSNKDLPGQKPELDYRVDSISKNKYVKDGSFWIDEHEIRRKMTRKEIEEFELKQVSKKYNL